MAYCKNGLSKEDLDVYIDILRKQLAIAKQMRMDSRVQSSRSKKPNSTQKKHKGKKRKGSLAFYWRKGKNNLKVQYDIFTYPPILKCEWSVFEALFRGEEIKGHIIWNRPDIDLILWIHALMHERVLYQDANYVQITCENFKRADGTFYEEDVLIPALSRFLKFPMKGFRERKYKNYQNLAKKFALETPNVKGTLTLR